jgi:site-specific DNA-methyltransferase (adenine-specific)
MVNARNLKELQQKAEDVGFIFQQLLVWDKGNSTPNKYYLNSLEFILMLRKGGAKNINNLGTSNLLRIPNIIGDKTHPTEKPVDLWEVLIKNSSEPGDTVLDCFMGTGSSGIACKKLGREYIGIEIDKKYYDISSNRLDSKFQKRLF